MNCHLVLNLVYRSGPMTSDFSFWLVMPDLETCGRDIWTLNEKHGRRDTVVHSARWFWHGASAQRMLFLNWWFLLPKRMRSVSAGGQQKLAGCVAGWVSRILSVLNEGARSHRCYVCAVKAWGMLRRRLHQKVGPRGSRELGFSVILSVRQQCARPSYCQQFSYQMLWFSINSNPCV